MTVFFRVTLFVLMAAGLTGCAANSGKLGWVTDPEHHWELSGFSVQAPLGNKWFREEKEETFPNMVSFRKIEATPVRVKYYPQFYYTKAFAYGLQVERHAGSRNDAAAEKLLREYLAYYLKKMEMTLESATFDPSQGGGCLAYSGNFTKTVFSTYYGPVKYSGVNGYLFLHPDQDNFIVALESRNAASEEISPANRDRELDHFFKSLRFTPRNAASPTPSPSKEAGT